MNIDIINPCSAVKNDDSEDRAVTDRGDKEGGFYQLLQGSKLTAASEPHTLPDAESDSALGLSSNDDQLIDRVVDDDETRDKNKELLALLAALFTPIEIKNFDDHSSVPSDQSSRLLTRKHSELPFHVTEMDDRIGKGKRLKVEALSTNNVMSKIVKASATQFNTISAKSGLLIKSAISQQEQSTISSPNSLTIPVVASETSYSNAPSLSPILTTAVNQPWQQSLVEQIVFFNRHEMTKAEISLHPKELGSLHVQLEMQDGRMDLNVAVMHSVVKGILESALPHLRASLAEQGIDLQNVQLTDNPDMSFNTGHSLFSDQSKYRQPKSMAKSVVQPQSSVTIEEEAVVKRAPSGVSVFA